jgi:hypothetical protein
MRILVAKDNGDYVQKYTTDSCPTYGKADIGNGSTGYNKIRLVVSKYSRLSLLGIRNYNYTGQGTTFMSRVISDPVYRSVSPAKNSVWNLGTTSNYWKNLYVTNINGVAVGSSPKFTDTTYSSKAAASGGTDVSLVTTGEKAIWNAKTSNTGTITGIKMNGASKGTSGVVDLGTVITSLNHTVTVQSGLKSDGTTISGTSSSAGSPTVALGDSGVTAGWYRRVQVNAKGIVVNGDQSDADSDTKNTTGTSSDTSTGTFYLVGAYSQSTYAYTYTKSALYYHDSALYTPNLQVGSG